MRGAFFKGKSDPIRITQKRRIVSHEEQNEATLPTARVILDPSPYTEEIHVSTIEKSIEVNVPVRTAYNQWTQFEDFPQFMEGVKEVTQLDDRHLHWKAEIGGKEQEWEAEITEQTPDQRIAWTSRGGAINDGVVMFQPLSDARSKIRLQVAYAPDGAVEDVGDALGMVSSRVQGDLERFKEFIEKRGRETGAWRGQI
jgi:uncharacterized membrane protein